MRELLQQYFNIAFLMGKPQDLPAGALQMRIGIAMALLTYVMALAVPYGVGRALLQAVIDLGCTALFLGFSLMLVGRQARFQQAYGALCGASAFINLAAVPLYTLRAPVTDASSASVSALADFVLLVWGLSVLAHIVRHTFDVKMVVSVLISFVYFLVLSSLIAGIMPLPETRTSEMLPSHQQFETVKMSAFSAVDLSWGFTLAELTTTVL